MIRRVIMRTPGWPWPLVLRVVAGAIFVMAGVFKFSRHGDAAADFDMWGIPAPDAMAYVVGSVEVLGGALLLLGLLTRPAAAALAVNMALAILTAGREEGGAVHLGLAPALLVVMVILLAVGGGAFSVDRALARCGGDGRRATAAAA